MGQQAPEASVLDYDGFTTLLRSKTRCFIELEGKTYYLTHTAGYWRAQDCAVMNEKGHFTDCSELAVTLSDFLALPWYEGKRIEDVYEGAKVYESIEE